MVGAILVYKNVIIGEGHHEYFGGPHAEVNCISSVKNENKALIPLSTLYVTLEPCCIENKTPACTALILSHNIKHVIIGVLDPNEKINGKGMELLQKHGVKVEVLDNEDCKFLIRKFILNLQKKPYIILKWAQSFDGFMGHKEKQIWLSNKFSKTFSHKLRTEVDGILIGKNTALIDNPQLTTRAYKGDNPIRILMDEKLEVNASSHLLSDEYPTIIINSVKNELVKNKKYIRANNIKDNNEVMRLLFDNGIYSLMVEGGKTVLDWFLENRIWDEAYVIKTNVRLLKKYKEINLIKTSTLSGNLLDKMKFDGDEIYKIENNNR